MVAFADLGMEAIYEFDVKDMPVTVAVDARGTSVHETGPREWQQRIGRIPVAVRLTGTRHEWALHATRAQQGALRRISRTAVIMARCMLAFP